ncbi:MAG: TolC family protein [Candidatus Eremiobacteraeota bacterium]|nr:TolC family protein [Candidatus Eremiobacteraeota bacterium]
MKYKYLILFVFLFLINSIPIFAGEIANKKDVKKADTLLKEKSPLRQWNKKELELQKNNKDISKKKKLRIGLSKSVEVALRNNLEHKMYLLKRDLATINVAKARKKYYPVISVSTSIQNDRNDTYKKAIAYNTHKFNLKQPLYYFGELSHNLRANKARKMASIFQVVDNAMSLETQVVTAYMNILKVQRELEIDNKFIKEVNKQLDLLGPEMEDGKKKKSANYRWKVLLKNYQQNAVTHENELVDNKLELSLLLQLESSIKIEIVPFGSEEFDADYEDYLRDSKIYSSNNFIKMVMKYALRMNPEVNMHDYQIIASRSDLKKEMSYNMPKIDFTPSHSCDGDDIPEFKVGITISFDVFNTGNWKEITYKKKQLEIEKLKKDIFVRRLKARIRGLFFKQIALMEQVHLKLVQAEEAYEYFKESKKKYEEGKVSVVTLIDAYDELYKNQLSGFDVLYEYYIEKQKFRESIGYSDFLQTPSIEEYIEKKGKVHLTKDASIGGPIFQLVEKGDIKAVGKLLNKNPNIVKKRNESEWNPLHTACFSGNIEMAKLFLKNGADINAESRTGMTPTYLAATEGYSQLVDMLAQKGAKLDVPAGNSLWTPLMRASTKGYVKTAEVLIKRGANIKAKSRAGWTPLHGAAEQGHMQIVKMLVKAGADINAKNNLGKTPLDLAVENGHDNVVEYLTKLDAKSNTVPGRKKK